MRNLLGVLVVAGIIGAVLLVGSLIAASWIHVVQLVWDLVGSDRFAIAVVLLCVGLIAAYGSD
jgi:hypothetical protein